jgi:hypothetical protein
VEALQYWWVAVAVGATTAFLLWRWFPSRGRTRGPRFAQARREFHLQREGLEAKFERLGALAAKPDAPRWARCDFDDDVAYARNRSTGELTAFVSVTIEIDGADDSSGGKDLVGNLRAATAVFRFDRTHWETDGRALFNLTPIEAIRYFRRDLEPLGQEVATRR